jgi:hypothetical protein
MTAELIPNVISYLVAQAQASAYLGAASPAVLVLDGPPPTSDQLVISPAGLTQRLWVGAEGMPHAGTPSEAASSEQGFAFLDNARTRDDQIEIRCAAECGSGDAVMATARGSGGLSGGGAFAVMAAVELMLRGGPNPSGSITGPGDSTMGGLVQWSEVAGPIGLAQEQQQNGAWALVTFRVSAFVRLTS